MDLLGDSMKKIILAGIGAVAVSAEKSRDIVDDLVKKGELTVEQGKVLNEELKHDVKSKLKWDRYSHASKKAEAEDYRETVATDPAADAAEIISSLDPDQLAALKEQLASMDTAE